MCFMPARLGQAALTTSLKENAMKLTKLAFTKRAVIVGLLAGSGILAASSFAMTAAGPAGQAGCDAWHGQHHRAKWEARRAEHLSELKDKLELKPEQLAAWNAFASASKPGMHSMGGDRQAMRAKFASLNTPQRLDRMLAMSKARTAKLAERAEVIKTFYAQLTPEQQGIFDAESMPDRHRDHEGRHSQS
jgi:periplasmic protein CpxP/Spy